MTDFSTEYCDLLNRIGEGIVERNERTGADITVLPGGTAFSVDLDAVPVAGNRRYWPKLAAAELAWQVLGTTHAGFIMKHAPRLWGKFVDATGHVSTAYGYRWRHYFGRDQLALAVDELRRDPTNRQVYVSAWDPGRDGLRPPELSPPNIPCPVGFSLNVVNDRLHCSVFIRSSDVFMGLPYDVMCYALLTDAVAAQLDKPPGTLHVTLAHAHIYDVHNDAWMACLGDEAGTGIEHTWMDSVDVEPSLPGWSIEEIGERPDDYVEHVARLSRRVKQHPWDPKPEIVT